MKNITFIFILFSLFLLIGLSSCSKNPDSSVTEYEPSIEISVNPTSVDFPSGGVSQTISLTLTKLDTASRDTYFEIIFDPRENKDYLWAVDPATEKRMERTTTKNGIRMQNQFDKIDFKIAGEKSSQTINPQEYYLPIIIKSIDGLFEQTTSVHVSIN